MATDVFHISANQVETTTYLTRTQWLTVLASRYLTDAEK